MTTYDAYKLDNGERVGRGLCSNCGSPKEQDEDRRSFCPNCQECVECGRLVEDGKECEFCAVHDEDEADLSDEVCNLLSRYDLADIINAIAEEVDMECDLDNQDGRLARIANKLFDAASVARKL